MRSMLLFILSLTLSLPAFADRSDIRANAKLYVKAAKLPVRTASGETLASLGINDIVVVAPGPVIQGEYVQIIIPNASVKAKTMSLFVSYEGLSSTAVEVQEKSIPVPSKYFMIQNIATEKIRVYEKMCDNGSCAHRLVVEADSAVGDIDKDKTIAGLFALKNWTKFYQDGNGHYPSWYREDLGLPPSPNQTFMSWMGKKATGVDSGIRGAFGWYAGFLEPDAMNQWTHGTYGWGANKIDAIISTRGFWANLFADPRSTGCTRTDNETIAYMRHILPVGTVVLKIYAKEAYADASRSKYSPVRAPWNYILTKNDVQKNNGMDSDRDLVLASGIPKSQWIEEGTYLIDAYPTAKIYKDNGTSRNSENGNVYGVPEREMKGVFLVDEGRLVNYEHPASIGVAGAKPNGRNSIPETLQAPENTRYSIPTILEREETLGGKKEVLNYLKKGIDPGPILSGKRPKILGIF